MSEIMLFNPRKKAKTTVKRARRRVKGTLVTNPKRSRRLRHNPRRAHRMHRNPITRRDYLSNTLMPAGIGAIGAVGMDIVLGMLPLPAALKTGAVRPLLRLAGAMGMGLLAGMATNKRIGAQVLAGASTVVVYDMLRTMAQKAMPTIPLGDVEPVETVTYADNAHVAELLERQGQADQMSAYADDEVSEYVGEYTY